MRLLLVERFTSSLSSRVAAVALLVYQTTEQCARALCKQSIIINILYRRITIERRALTLLAALPATLLAGVLSVPVPPFTAVVLPDEAIVAF